ncbi:MAG: hypothetical protein Q4A92_02625 [Corynebacterium sp.]|nr:hypothetical protein [Corynebacterium sp.]
MTLNFVPEIGIELANAILTIQQSIHQTLQRAMNEPLDASYSNVPGLKQLGESHGQVLSGCTGSASEVLNEYSQFTGWISEALSACIDVIAEQEKCNARALDIADEGGTVGAATLSIPKRPPTQYSAFNFAQPPSGSAASLDQLAADFSGTNIGAIREASHTWSVMSGEVADAANRLSMVAEELVTFNVGEVFEAAAQTLSTAADVGKLFADNAATMAATLEKVDEIHSWGQHEVTAAQAKVNAIQDPALKKLAEQEFLTSFMGAELPSALQAGVPPIAGLMAKAEPSKGSNSGETTGGSKHAGGGGGGQDSYGGEIEVGFDAITGNGSIGEVIQDATIPGATNLLSSGGNSMNPLNALGTIGAIVEGVHKIIGGIGTQQAGITPDLAPPQALPLMSADKFGGGYSPGNYVATPFEAVSGPASAPRSSNMTKTGMNGIESAANYGKPAAGPISGTTAPSGAHTPGMSPMPGTVGAPITHMLGKRPNSMSIGQTGSPNGGITHGFGAVPGNPVAATGGAPQAASSRTPRGGMMGGVPMGAAQQQQPQNKVKALTSKVERNKNIRDLIGELPPVLDGPIGAWVRE